ncbi:THO complex subunit 2 [Selaginella moellendorffii]|uniref:THO complex subunit 2 n=1 Tax=Selaginella moellendorffii TaxID=88036 RepID=UPI000D1D0AF0|nr:THO complex subunit 2 [Selaginella moellendorffii]|eukprot:XP_024534234.1 THO complex subunit 2 [Selaginella moellendorffii]
MALIALNCKYVTSEHIREWKSTNAATKIHAAVPPDRFIYELCWTMVRGELPLSKCRVGLDAVNFLESTLKEDIASNFADAIAHMSLELTVPGEFRSRLVDLAKWLAESGLVPVRLFQERCEAEFLWEVEMIKIKAPDLKSKEVRVNTRLLYQQTKFNLLREESEGYAKLLTLLKQSGSDSSQSSSAVASSIKSLIGHFDLDPNRVFDIVLEFFELHPENTSFIGLMPLFRKSHLCHILGFKFQYYQRPEIEEPVPTGLYRLAATLVKADFVDLDSIYAHLTPKDEEAFEQYEEILKRRMEEANRIGKINLAATGKDLMEEEKPGDVNIDLYAALDGEVEATAERVMELVTNQKLGLLDGFLTVGDWHHANILFERLAALNPVAHERISSGLIRIIENTIAPIYNRLRPSYFSKLNQEVSTRKAPVTELRKELFQMLSWIGPYLYRDVILLQKVCKVLRGYYSSAVSAVNSTRSQEAEHKDARAALKEARLKVEEALSACLLPSLQLLPANPAVCIAIWDVLSLLSYEVRYRIYGEWEKDDESFPMLLAARQTAKLDTRRILKRLAKENLKQLGRQVAKLAHANPLTVLRTIVHQIEAYKDMIAPVVDAFKYLTQLEYDVLEYVVLERLAQGGREKLKEDGLNLSDWLQSLASFWGTLCKKHPSMELRGLFQYLVNQLKKGDGIELVVLQELMQQMANVEYTENVTEDQLEAMSGGETLRYQATAFGLVRNNKAFTKSTNRLRDALLSKEEPKLALPLVLLIAQHRSNIVTKCNAPHIKMVSEQFDRCHGALLQYVEFLYVAVTPSTAYAQLMPSLDELVHKYLIEPEVAFLIYRPVLGLFKTPKGSDTSGQIDESQSSKDLVLELPHRKAITWTDLLSTVHTMLPLKAWNSLSPELYLTFWGLSLHDLYVPRQRYELEIAKQRSSLRALEESSDNSYAAITKRKKDKEKIQEVLDRLSSELQKQEQHVATVQQRLLREKDSWLTSCPDSQKINMEFLQRCIFPRCVFSTIDAVYCARFVQNLHSLGTPFFNTVNHIDCLICKTLQPMIYCCTEYEAGRLGRFLFETLKMAYHWKSDESVYDRECGNMPGFAVLYRDPNSQRVTFAQFVRIQWKWSSRLTKLLIHCLESSEYMEIRNALTILTKISSVFPITKKTGINIERRVNKIKLDDREDLKVLATGVSAALASRKNAWMSDEEFGMGYIDLKPPPVPAKAAPSLTEPQQQPTPGVASMPVRSDGKAAASRPAVPAASTELKQASQTKSRKPSSEPANGIDARSTEVHHSKQVAEEEARLQPRKATQTAVSTRSKPEQVRDDPPSKTPKVDTSSNAASVEKEAGAFDNSRRMSSSSHTNAGASSTRSPVVTSSRPGAQDLPPKPRIETTSRSAEPKASIERERDRQDAHEGAMSNHMAASSKSPSHRDDGAHFLDKDRQIKRAGSNDESERKRRKAEPVERNVEAGEIRTGERWLASERPRSAEHGGYDDRPSLEKGRERPDRDYRMERSDRDDYGDKLSRDRLVPRDRSVDRNSDRAGDWNFDSRSRDERSNKDERPRPRHTDSAGEQSHGDDRFSQGLPPPPPLPPNMVPHLLSSAPGSRREEEVERRRAMQRLSPHRDEKRRADEGGMMLMDEKRRRDEDNRERKRDERELLAIKMEKEREREREKMAMAKDELDGAAGSKRRKLKRDHISGEGFLPPPPPPPPPAAASQQQYERKAVVPQQARNVYMEPPLKDVPSKLTRRDHEQMYDREWEEEKRQRAELKRRHHRK